MARNVLPPFGDQVSEILTDPDRLKLYSGCTAKRGTIWILTGEAAPEMHRDMHHHLNVILPPHADPSGFSWGFVHGHEPALIWCDALDYILIESIWKALERDGVRSALFGDGTWPDTYKKTEALCELAA